MKRLGHLDKLKISDSRYQHLEETILQNFTQRDGWIASQNATGSWSNNDLSLSEGTGDSGGGFDFSRFVPQQQQQQQQQISGVGGSQSQQQPQQIRGNISGFGGGGNNRDQERGGGGEAGSTSGSAGFPTSAGRQLGSAEQRRNVASEREKRLLALERSKQQTAEQSSTSSS